MLAVLRSDATRATGGAGDFGDESAVFEVEVFVALPAIAPE